MRLRLIAESADDPMTAKVMDNLRGVTSGSMIDNDDCRVSWPFVYSVDLGLYLGDNNSYHKDIFSSQGQRVSKVLRNIYQGGDLDSYYQPVPNTLKPGVAGRLGLDFTQLVDDAEGELSQPADPTLHTKFKAARVVAFFKDHPQWVGMALKELLQRGIAQPDSFVVIKKRLWTVDEKINHKAEPAAPTKPSETTMPPLPAGPSKKTWQGEMSKIKPGQKWWAPYSEGKK